MSETDTYAAQIEDQAEEISSLRKALKRGNENWEKIEREYYLKLNAFESECDRLRADVARLTLERDEAREQTAVIYQRGFDEGVNWANRSEI